MARRKRRGLSASQKRELWERWQRGQSSNDIARALGKLRGSIHSVLASHGGIEPPPRRRSRLALSLSEREEISRGLAEGQSMREIAASIQRAPSTVSREIGRHHGREGTGGLGEASTDGGHPASRGQDQGLRIRNGVPVF